MEKQYRLIQPPNEFWEALMQVRNYLLRDEVFLWFCSMNTFRHPLADAFWCVDAWLNVAWENEDQESTQD